MYDLNRLMALYEDITRGRLVAVNVFGEPFFEVGGAVIKVSPETGDEEAVTPIGDFDFATLDDYWTASTLKLDWESQNGPIGDDYFLVPITPFVLGGEFVVANLMKIPLEEAIALYRQIRAQISGRPDGAKVSIEVQRSAMTKEGGENASIRNISRSDNRGSGACIGAQCRDVPDGGRIQVDVKE